ncbi:hypothetical protein [Aquisalimonas sp.]|uniref:hypothetical protein n=1 Tax=Aquisalimonas sp. TaxID=1872621 RepID=UPI0025B81662|nr:hypothetical protein [Aquisalimonas sp.]
MYLQYLLALKRHGKVPRIIEAHGRAGRDLAELVANCRDGVRTDTLNADFEQLIGIRGFG